MSRLYRTSLRSLVGRTPWSAADALVGLSGQSKSRTRGSGADEGVRPTKCPVRQAVAACPAMSLARSLLADHLYLRQAQVVRPRELHPNIASLRSHRYGRRGIRSHNLMTPERPRPIL